MSLKEEFDKAAFQHADLLIAQFSRELELRIQMAIEQRKTDPKITPSITLDLPKELNGFGLRSQSKAYQELHKLCKKLDVQLSWKYQSRFFFLPTESLRISVDISHKYKRSSDARFVRRHPLP